MSEPILTYADAVEHAMDYMGASLTEAQALRDCQRAVQAAYRSLTAAKTWTYLYREGRVNTVAPYSTGTVAYDHTGGTYERQVTLTGGTFPDWAADGELRIGVVRYRVSERKSATVLTLDDVLNPGADVASTAYELYRDTYVLPEDFVAQDLPISEGNWAGLCYSHPTDHLWSSRYVRSTGTPTYYTITGDPGRHPGRLAVQFYPAPDSAKAIDFIYHRKPRSLVTREYADGKVSGTAASTTVTGSNATFADRHVGCVLRVGSTSTRPTSWLGSSPASFEARILEVVDAGELRVDAAIPATFSLALYTISDPVDIEPGTMQEAFQRGIEWQLKILRQIFKEGAPNAAVAYDLALRQAMAADSRSFQGRVMGESAPRRVHPKYFPYSMG